MFSQGCVVIRAVRPSWRQRTHTLLLQFNIQRIPKRSTRRRDAGVERPVHRRGDSRQCLIFASARPSRTLLAHYSYNLGKCAGCSPGMTWHWDNLHIAPSTPFTIARGDRRVIRAVTPTVVNFAPPAPRGAARRALHDHGTVGGGLVRRGHQVAIRADGERVAHVGPDRAGNHGRARRHFSRNRARSQAADVVAQQRHWIAQDFAIFAPPAPTPRPHPKARRPQPGSVLQRTPEIDRVLAY